VFPACARGQRVDDARETTILASYFFVLVILAVYGWHRYYLVYLYMKHKDEQPVPRAAMFDPLPS
jgi:hypothetical protein